ncbi:TatD family hydrolase [Porphyromonas circumdentaria]|uniref:TatD DNase family protein n=1 Tax=Porphyromonas circumdentaria TaxID=29524 RepID=A0A1T4MBB6_9PORP|nr:TatD family hydrolase [Porphyromonas circumdentaria]MBB6275833.1 TatD DNase family protein [Porphyromonas circumdentaria]MDO4721662.1 TatD family hydrolase [Porphyromonas circumdentaria]SJZ64171.1 TatD DNase family protein [Porphyromonas circumdentaria]
MLRIADSHTHIFDEAFDLDGDEMVSRALSRGVEKMLLPNIDLDTLSALWATHSRFPDLTDIAIGIHPTSITSSYKEDVQKIALQLKEGLHGCVAIGEIGLDYYWDKTFYTEQQKALHLQIELALEHCLPIVLHTREAHKEMLQCIASYDETSLKGVFHSFTGTEEELKELLSFERFYIGINGVVTFKKSPLREFIAQIPLERLLVETDAPYLAPTPYRGKRNEPSYIINTLQEIAHAYQKPLEEIAEATYSNYLRLFHA